MDGQGFKDQLLAQLSLLGEVTSRPMFGGHGLYWRGVIFGIRHRDRMVFMENSSSFIPLNRSSWTIPAFSSSTIHEKGESALMECEAGLNTLWG